MPDPLWPQSVGCTACGRYLGSSLDRGAANRLLAWHRTHCEAALDLSAADIEIRRHDAR